MPAERRLSSQVRFIFWLIAFGLGFFHSWMGRNDMNPDGISYLDMADAFLAGKWREALSGYWSPFYPWVLGIVLFLLKPTPRWEFPTVHLVNFAVYLGAFAAFDFFATEIIRIHHRKISEETRSRFTPLQEGSLLALGYTIVIGTSLNFVSVSLVTPDLCVAMFFYLASGILFRLRNSERDRLTSGTFGLVLALGYLAKQIMLPMAFIFLGVSALLVRGYRKVIPHLLFASLGFLLLSGPYVWALSSAQSRFTMGDCLYPYLPWLRSQAVLAKRLPTVIFDSPRVDAFKGPEEVTYPRHYDTRYWLSFVRIHSSLRQQLANLVPNLKRYLRIFLYRQGYLSLGLLILLWLGGRSCFGEKKTWAETFLFALPAVAGLGACAFTHEGAGDRFVAPFLTAFWFVLFSGIRLPRAEWREKSALSVMALILTFSFFVQLYYTAGDLRIDRHSRVHRDEQIFKKVKELGLRPGDQIAYFGDPRRAFWARLARFRIKAEIGLANLPHFWEAKDETKSAIFQALEDWGIKAVFTEEVPSRAFRLGWQRIPETDTWVVPLGAGRGGRV